MAIEWDTHSEALLAMAHPDLKRIMDAALIAWNSTDNRRFVVLESFRSAAAQERAYQTGHSKAKAGESAHNYFPSLAVDIAPAPINWNDTQAFKDLARIVLSVAAGAGVQLTWGGAWKTIVDMPHFELSNWRVLAKQEDTNAPV